MNLKNCCIRQIKILWYSAQQNTSRHHSVKKSYQIYYHSQYIQTTKCPMTPSLPLDAPLHGSHITSSKKSCGLWSVLHWSNGWKFLLYNNSVEKVTCRILLKEVISEQHALKTKSFKSTVFHAIASLRCLRAWLINNDIFKGFDAINYLNLWGMLNVNTPL